MNDLIVLAFAVIMLLAVLPMFLMNRAFKGAGKRNGERKDASLATGVPVAGDDAPVRSKNGMKLDDSADDGAGDGGDGGGGGD